MHRPKILDEPFVYVILCGIGALLYFKSLAFGFTYLDDNVIVLGNLPFLENLGNIFQAFTHGVFAMVQSTTLYYRPLLTISFMPEAVLGGSLAFLYHLVNVGIHLAAACLVYALFTKLKYSKNISLAAALIFVVHPALAQAVAWIPGRNDSLLAVFVLASFIYFLKFVGEKKRSSILWSVLFFALALFTKETAIVLPLLCVGYLWMREELKKSALMQFIAGWLIIIALWLPLRLISMSNPMPMSLRGAISSFAANLPGTVPLLGKVFFPFNLSVLPIAQDTIFGWGFLALALILGLALLQMKDRQTPQSAYFMMLFGLAWFLIFLWPPFIISDPSGTTYFIEHRLYLPIIGLLIFIAESRANRCLQLWFFITLIFFGITFAHENVFSNRLVFWQDAVSHSPHSSLAQKNLGAMYYLDQNYALAEEYSKKALALNPEEPMAHNNLGLIAAARGKWKEAEEEYRQEILFNPYYDSAHYNFGLLYYQMGDFINARKQWEETYRLNPNYGGIVQALLSLDAQGK